MKTPEELNALKEEFETVNRKLNELTEEELEQVSGGYWEESQHNADILKAFMDNLFQVFQMKSGNPEQFKEVAEMQIEKTYLVPPHRKKLLEIMWNYYQALKK